KAHRTGSYELLANGEPPPVSIDDVYTGLSEVDGAYTGLSAAEQMHLADYAESLVGGDRHAEAEAIAFNLAAVANAPIDNLLRAFVARDRFSPGVIFHRAPSDLRDRLLERVEWDEEHRRSILSVLAWIGDEAIVEAFASWTRNAPSWSDGFSLADYALGAGWELTDAGEARKLYFQQCRKLTREAPDSPDVFQVFGNTQDACPWCRQCLTNLFDLNPIAIGLPRELGDRLQVKTCEGCTAYGTVYGEYDEAGLSYWSPSNERPTYLPDDVDTWERMPSNCLKLADRRFALFAAAPFLSITFSHVGGYPNWLQNAEKPICPHCMKTMMFLAQVDLQDSGVDWADGVYYAFVCSDCRTTATTFQCT
ncbi:MAG: DUF1963 domain-containing protein, partial [Cyanobacteria bacterium J06639_1]